MSDPLSQLPYYKEYVDQILRPRVGRMIDELRTHLTDHVWGALLDRMAQDQKPGHPQPRHHVSQVLVHCLASFVS